MNPQFAAWLNANHYNVDELTKPDKAAQLKHLESAWKAETQAKDKPTDYDAEAAAIRAENKRIQRIDTLTLAAQKACVSSQNKIDRLDAIRQQAIDESWTVERFEIAMLHEERRVGPMVTTPHNQQTALKEPKVLEAAMLMAVNYPRLEKEYKPETLDAAHTHFRNITLQQLVLMGAQENGYQSRAGSRIHMGNIREVLHYGFNPVAAGGYSSLTLPGILGAVANKQLLAGYMEEDDTWREVSSIKVANNFQTRTYYRMLDNMEYEEVGPGGEIKHGSVDQESYTAGLKTFAKMFSLTRQSIINDDMNAFADMRNRLGRGAKKKFNNWFWTKFLANHSSFFTSGRGNYITGATTTLLTDGVGLGLGVKAFRQMKSPNSAGSDDGGKRLNARPSILLVPPELEYAADQLFMGEKINVGSGPGDTNTYRNKYRPVVNAWLSDSAFTGYSTTAWYLFRSASDLPMMAVSFLNGQEMPTVENADADFDTLGIQFRGFHDFDADQAEYLCGVKSKGAA